MKVVEDAGLESKSAPNTPNHLPDTESKAPDAPSHKSDNGKELRQRNTIISDLPDRSRTASDASSESVEHNICIMSSLPHRLQQVIEGWDELPESAKQTILGIVDTFSDTEEK